MGRTVRGSNTGGGEFFRPSRPALGPTQRPVRWVPVFPGGKVRLWRDADPSPLLAPRSWKSKAIALPPLGHNRTFNGVTLPLTVYCITAVVRVRVYRPPGQPLQLFVTKIITPKFSFILQLV
jgi:hypothetical protein